MADPLGPKPSQGWLGASRARCEASAQPPQKYDPQMTPNHGNRRSPMAPDEEAAARVLRQFRQIFNAVKTHFQQVEKKVGLGGAQLWALGVIRDTPGIGMGGLAKALNIQQPTASNLVKSLVERELVVATKSEVDRRAVGLRLLPAGAKLLKRSPGPFTGVLPVALAALDAESLARLEVDLARLIDVLHADKRGANVPLGNI